jgi:hypothetical protein
LGRKEANQADQRSNSEHVGGDPGFFGHGNRSFDTTGGLQLKRLNETASASVEGVGMQPAILENFEHVPASVPAAAGLRHSRAPLTQA